MIEKSSEITSKKIWRPFIINISLVIMLVFLGVFIGIFFNSKKLIEQQLETTARAHFQNIVLTRRWNAMHGGVFVEKTPEIVSNPYLENPDIKCLDGKTYTKKNPALMTREISEIAKNTGAFQFHITSLNPLNPGNAPDAFEKQALTAFDLGENEFFTREEENGTLTLRYMAPLITEESCLPCHAKQGYKVGDVRGGISVSLFQNL